MHPAIVFAQSGDAAAAQNDGTQGTKANAVEDAGKAMQTAKKAMQEGDVNKLIEAGKDYVIKYGPNVLYAILILIFGWMAAKSISGIFKRLLRKAKTDDMLISFVGNLVYMGIMAMVVITSIQQLGIPTASFVAVIGAAGLAVGFALQGSLSNFASGVMIIIFKPFKTGDFIEAGGEAGIVEELAVFATTMKTPDNKKIIIPNAAITGGNITNYSAKPIRRVDFVFGIGYGDNIQQAKDLLHKLCAEESRILKDPEVTIAVNELADSSVNLVCRPWVNSADYWPVYFDMTERVKNEMDNAGLNIPFPQRDVHVYQHAVEE